MAIWCEKWTSQLVNVSEKVTEKAARAFTEVLHSVQCKCFKKKNEAVFQASQTCVQDVIGLKLAHKLQKC